MIYTKIQQYNSIIGQSTISQKMNLQNSLHKYAFNTCAYLLQSKNNNHNALLKLK